MKIDVHVHHDPVLHWKIDQIIDRLRAITEKENAMSQSLDDLTTQVKKNTDVEAGAVVLIQGIAQKLADAQNDPVKLAALQSDLNASADALAAAVAANTTT